MRRIRHARACRGHPEMHCAHLSEMAGTSPAMTKAALFWLLAGDDVGPQRLDIARLQHLAPRRHVVLALGDGIGEARILLRWKRAQVEAAAGIVHVGAVAGDAVDRVDL